MKWGFFTPWKSLRVLKTQGEEQPVWTQDGETLAVNPLESPPDIIHHHLQLNPSSSPVTITTSKSNGWLAANLTMDRLTVVTTEVEPENGQQNGARLQDETDSEIILQRRLSITETLEVVLEEPERPYFMPPQELTQSVTLETETFQQLAPSSGVREVSDRQLPEVSIDCRKLATLARRSSDPMTTREVTATIHRTSQRRPFRTIFATGYKVDVEPEPHQSYAYSSGNDEKNLPRSPIPRQSVVLRPNNVEHERKSSDSSSDNEFSLSIISSISNNNGVGAYTVPERVPRTAVMKKGIAAPLALPESSLSSSLVSSDTESARQNVLQDKWRVLFDKFDPEGFGEIPWPDFMAALQTPQFIDAVGPGKVLLLQTLAMSHAMNSGAITYQHFVNIMSGKRSRSFECAVHHRDREISSESDFHLLPMGQKQTGVRRMARLIADEFLTDERDRKYYADHYRCLPPPLFIISVTLIELGFFTYYTVWHGEISSSGPLPMDSPFVYRPDKRQEVWRFLFYMVLHAGWVHLMFNLLVQLLVGLPLEMVHGSLRIGCVYMAGVLAGSLGTSVFDPDVYLVGASGGVYALLAAHLANVLLNYNNMEFGLVRLLGVFLIASVDVGFAIYDRYAASISEPGAVPPVSYVAHLTGALAGLTIGLLVLKNFEQRLREQLMWWFALGVYAACTLFAILFNVFHPGFPYKY